MLITTNSYLERIVIELEEPSPTLEEVYVQEDLRKLRRCYWKCVCVCELMTLTKWPIYIWLPSNPMLCIAATYVHKAHSTHTAYQHHQWSRSNHLE